MKPLVADFIATINDGSGDHSPTFSGVGVAGPTTINSPSGVARSLLVATTAGAVVTYGFNTALSEVAIAGPGLYTLGVAIYASVASPIVVVLGASGQRSVAQEGWHTYLFPFPFEATTPITAAVYFEKLLLAAEVALGSLRIFKHDYRFDAENLEMRGAAAPGSGGRFLAGDKVWFDQPTAGGFIGTANVAAGSPGTWKNFGVVAP